MNTTVGSSTTVAVLTCNIGQLVSISKLEGVGIMVNIPSVVHSASKHKVQSVTTVTSDNDPNSSNNTVSESYIVAK